MRLLNHREALARRQLAARQEAMAGAQAQADQLDGMRREYRDRLESAGSTGVRAGDLQMWRRFNQSLDDVVDVQTLQVEKLRQELEQAQAACLAALVKRRGGEKLEAARDRDEQVLQRRRERTAASDRASRRSTD
jgi:flagellar export protein FliJ